MDYDDDYDDNYDDNYDEYDYDDDAADDWEAEAAEEEEREKAEQALRATLAEKKLATRAPVYKLQKEAGEETLPEDVQREVERMRQVANNLGGSLISGDSSDLLADQPVDTAVQAKTFGSSLASHLRGFLDKPNFDIVIASLFEKLGKEFNSTTAINDMLAKVAVTMEEVKRDAKKGGRKDTVKEDNRKNNDDADVLGFGEVEDKGGAVIDDDQANPW